MLSMLGAEIKQHLGHLRTNLFSLFIKSRVKEFCYYLGRKRVSILGLKGVLLSSPKGFHDYRHLDMAAFNLCLLKLSFKF